MFPFTASMCFGAGSQTTRGQRWVLVISGTSGRSSVVLEREPDSGFFVRVSERPEDEERTRTERKQTTLSQSECCLLESLDVGTDRRLPTGPFLTLQRQRTRGPVSAPQAAKLAAVDDAYDTISRRLLAKSGVWDFNTFSLDVSTGGRALSVLLVHLFCSYGYIEHFHLDAVKVWHCFCLIEAGYHSNNPYHNAVHAADVTQAMHCFLKENQISAHLSPLEGMASLISAVAHDLDHPGVNQPFLIATSNHLASLYKNFSVLENHHWRSAVSCLNESGIFDHLPKDVWEEIEWQIPSLILATDITRQQEFLSRFRRYLDSNVLDLQDKEYRHFILQMALKCADLCNPCRPWTISKRWSYQVCQEFYRQGDYERQLNLPVTPMCDRTRTTIAKIQADFFRFVAAPLFDIWNTFFDSPLSNELLTNLRCNHAEWEKEVARERMERERQEAMAAPPRADVVEEVEEREDEEEETMVPLATSSVTTSSIFSRHGEDDEEDLGGAYGRRYSMPLSVPKMLPRTTIRRQSFPKMWPASKAWPLEDVDNPDDEGFLTFPLHRSPHISLRALSVEQLRPKPSIMSLSTGFGVSLLRRMDIAAEVERRLVHQPSSYPPYIMQGSRSGSASRVGSRELVRQTRVHDTSDNGAHHLRRRRLSESGPSGVSWSPSRAGPSGEPREGVKRGASTSRLTGNFPRPDADTLYLYFEKPPNGQDCDGDHKGKGCRGHECTEVSPGEEPVTMDGSSEENLQMICSGELVPSTQNSSDCNGVRVGNESQEANLVNSGEDCDGGIFNKQGDEEEQLAEDKGREEDSQSLSVECDVSVSNGRDKCDVEEEEQYGKVMDAEQTASESPQERFDVPVSPSCIKELTLSDKEMESSEYSPIDDHHQIHSNRVRDAEESESDRNPCHSELEESTVHVEQPGNDPECVEQCKSTEEVEMLEVSVAEREEEEEEPGVSQCTDPDCGDEDSGQVSVGCTNGTCCSPLPSCDRCRESPSPVPPHYLDITCGRQSLPSDAVPAAKLASSCRPDHPFTPASTFLVPTAPSGDRTYRSEDGCEQDASDSSNDDDDDECRRVRRRLTRLKSDSDVLSAGLVNFARESCEKTWKKKKQLEPGSEPEETTSSWCFHISRSLSSDLTGRDFDSLMPAWRGSTSSLATASSTRLVVRRASAPVAVRTGQISTLRDLLEAPRGGLRGGSTGGSAAYSRRWSVPAESVGAVPPSEHDGHHRMSRRPLQKELVRRHSFGLLEPFLVAPSSESDPSSSSDQTPEGSSCSSSSGRNSSVPPTHLLASSVADRPEDDHNLDQEGGTSSSVCSEGQDLFLPTSASFQHPSRPAGDDDGGGGMTNRRRGSLPADIPISLMRRAASSRISPSPAARGSSATTAASKEFLVGGEAELPRCWDQPRRRGSAGEILYTFVGPVTTSLARFQGIGVVPPSTVGCAASQGAQQPPPRRGSGGLELLSGLWRSRTIDWLTSDPVMPSLLTSGRFKLPRQSCSLDSPWTSEWRPRNSHSDEFISPLPGNHGNHGATSGISSLLCQRRRGSVPLEVSLFSLISGSKTCGDKDN